MECNKTNKQTNQAKRGNRNTTKFDRKNNKTEIYRMKREGINEQETGKLVEPNI